MALNPPYEYRATVTRVVDGDTFDADVDLGFHTHVHLRFRMADIDAPETYGVKKTSNEYHAGRIAKTWLAHQIEGETVILTTMKAGKYGRWLATIRDEKGMNLNQEMIALGLASPYD